MRLLWILLGCLLIPAVALAADAPDPDPDIAFLSTRTEAHKNVAFGPDALQKLDIYAPAQAKSAPTLIFVHGGEWTKHDKRTVHYKPKAFNDMGVIFVSTNYRLSPQSAHPAQVSDVAAAIAWVHNNIARYGGDPDNIFIMGHPAGCHLVTLASLDPRYLKAVGLEPSNLRGVIAWSGGAYDLPRLVQKSTKAGSYGGYIIKVFGEKEEGWRDASPIAHVGDSKALPPYLFASVAPGASYEISQKMVELINATGVTSATSVLFEGKSHQTVNTELGAPGDQSFRVIRDFITRNSAQPLRLPEVVVTAARSSQLLEDVPQTMTVVDRESLDTRQPLNLNEALREEPGIFANQAAPQGSPIIRGLNGNKVLYLWNGIPLNNGTTPSGPNGNLNQFPLGAADRIEVLRGPGSLQYGSSAIGGVINIIAKQGSFSETPTAGGDVSARYGSVNNEFTEYTDLWAGGKKYSLMGGFTRQDVGDYQGGDGFTRQAHTGFNATGGYLDLAYKPLNNQTIRLSGIFNSREDIGYYASSKTNASGIPRTVQPYERRGVYRFDYEINNLGFLSDALKAYAYYQHYGQKLDTNTETATILTTKDVVQDQDIYGGGIQNTMAIQGHSLTYGGDYRSEDLNSTPVQNALTKATGVVATTTPTGNTPNGSYDVLDAFAIAQLNLLRDLTVSVGGRVEQTHLQSRPKASDVIPNAGYTLQDLQVDKTWFATTWSVGAIYRIIPTFDLSANMASGFRAPSFSDVLSTGTPVFSTKVASIPSPGVGPEKAITYEVGPRFHNEQWSVNLSAYWTHLYDYIRSTSGGAVTIAGVDYTSQTNSNSGAGFIRGLELALSFKPGDFSFFGNVNYTEGEDTTFHEYLRFIPPLYGTVGVRYDSPSKRWWTEATEVMVNELFHHAPKDEQDTSFATDPGLGSPNTTTNKPLRSDFSIPGYAITNLRGGWVAWKNDKRRLDLTLELNNLFDKAYREAYSQQEQVAPGFNCVAGVKLTF